MAEKVCPICGMTESRFKATMYLGCPDCYKNLNVKEVIMSCQGASVHIGRKAFKRDTPEIAVLRAEYQNAVRFGRMDDAERLKGMILARGGRP